MESVVDAVTERVGDAKVVRVLLEIGKLSGVVPDAIRFCFDLATAETTLEGATLEIIETPGRARCLQCLADVELFPPALSLKKDSRSPISEKLSRRCKPRPHHVEFRS
jgi:hydrogenase nickel incorporation protein HypA/HybF